MVGIEPTTQKTMVLPPTPFVKEYIGVLVRLTTCKRLTDSLPKLSLIAYGHTTTAMHKLSTPLPPKSVVGREIQKRKKVQSPLQYRASENRKKNTSGVAFTRPILPQPSPKTGDCFNERFMATQHEQEAREKVFPAMYFLVCKGRSNDDVGVARGTVFQALRPGAGFKTGDSSLKKKGGGYRRTTHPYTKTQHAAY